MPEADFAALRKRLSVPKPAAAELFACAEALACLADESVGAGLPVRRVAVAGDLTTQLLERAIACAIAQEGELPLIYSAPFGAARQECLDPASGLHAFRPEVVVLVPDWREAVPPLATDAPAASAHEMVQAQVRMFEAMWSALESRGCNIIQHLLVPPPQLLRGVADRRSAGSAIARTQALNEALLEAGEGRVIWLEADRLASQLGLAAWSAARFYHAGKLGFDPRFLSDYLPWFRGAWRAATGRTKKVLVLDLDDTLWGGTIGDDGLEGIALGTDHGATGEAYAQWQQYLAQLGQRGVVLAVCSKNDPTVAATGFDHPASKMKRDDFAAFVCNWEDKATGLRQIADELGLGLDALVFVDDNPAERSLVEQVLPEVTVLDLGTEPAQFIERLEAGHWFDLQAYTDSDLHRRATYVARRKARTMRNDTVDLASYLAGLEMLGRLAPAQASDLPRLAQLELKTNQFNLTTRRYSQAQLASMLRQKDRLVVAFQLKDKFGNHGTVSSLIAVREGDEFRIDSWLMSCRVLARTAEQFILAALARMAHEQGATALTGEYVPSQRNGVVADLYPRLGFLPAGAEGRFWRRDLDKALDDLASPIGNER